MTRRLLLIRHAKSSWDLAGVQDHERPLSRRGRRGAAAIGEWLDAHAIRPDEVIHSTAARAVETWERIGRALGAECEVRAERMLYMASPRTMLEVLRSASGRTVAMVGHNPGCAMFAAGMCRMPSGHPDFNRYPTCGTCILDFEIPAWAEVAAGIGEIADYIVPRQLLG